MATSATVVPFRRVAILGLGLMGASLGMALRAGGLARSVAGYDAAQGMAQRACERGAVDQACATAAEAVTGASLVVLAAPVLTLRGLLAEVAPYLAPRAIVTDLGSTKAEVTHWAEEALPNAARFVGGHPMAGSECSGVEAADAGLYRGCVWCLTPTERTSARALQRTQSLIAALGAQPLMIAPAQHDAAVALISHLPLLSAVALMLTAAGMPNWPAARRLAAGGFRDGTRVASGDPRMGHDICLTNTQPLLTALDAYLATLHDLRERLASADTTLEATLYEAKTLRDAWLARG
ncbi:MAG: hypothetical protein OJF49_000991 [Ktedonobacterales bacterium]|jgi:prephenate dehydrogenase|nr:MAG: hypothetical protein OJF49_000991 [Ktedonobacterales bacterium]